MIDLNDWNPNEEKKHEEDEPSMGMLILYLLPFAVFFSHILIEAILHGIY